MSQQAAEWKQTDPDDSPQLLPSEESVFAEVKIPCKLSVELRVFTACGGSRATLEVNNIQILFDRPDVLEFDGPLCEFGPDPCKLDNA